MKPHETTAQCVERKLGRKLRLIRVARGEEPADIVFKNATYLNVFSNDFCHGDIAVSDGSSPASAATTAAKRWMSPAALSALASSMPTSTWKAA